MKAWLLAAALVLVALALAVSTPASATREWSPLQLSRSGHQWSDNLQRPLFKRGFDFVPGDSETRTFHARNRADKSGRLRVVVELGNGQGWLAQRALRMRVRIGDRPWIRVTGGQHQQPTSARLRAGQTVPIGVRVRLKPNAGNEQMNRRLHFSVHVTLTRQRK